MSVRSPFLRDFPVTVIAVLCVSLYLIESLMGRDWSAVLGAVPFRIRDAWTLLLSGQDVGEALTVLGTLVTAAFLHASPEHVIYNLVFLWCFGVLGHQVLGRSWIPALVFLVTAVCGNVAEVMLHPGSPARIIGASGGVCGLEGLYVGLALRWRLPDADVWPLAAPVSPLRMMVFALVGFLGDVWGLQSMGQGTLGGIAHGAHIGGFLSGVCIAFVVTSCWATHERYRWFLHR